MTYNILVNNKPMHPDKGEPYIFDSLQEAINMVSTCYGLSSLGKDVNIVEVENDK